jgi:hypothetical protein
MKLKGGSKKQKNKDVLFDVSSQGSSGEDFDKFDLDNLDEADKENLCNDFKKKIKDANLTKE